MTRAGSHEALVRNYLHGLEQGDISTVLSVFAEDGVVESPLYGTLAASVFYPSLFADTARSRLTLRATMVGRLDDRPVVSFWFDFDWTLANGEPAPFTVVDIAELGDGNLITCLHIIYDTAPIRGAFDRRAWKGDPTPE